MQEDKDSFFTKQFDNWEHFEEQFIIWCNQYHQPVNIKRSSKKYNDKTMKELFDRFCYEYVNYSPVINPPGRPRVSSDLKIYKHKRNKKVESVRDVYDNTIWLTDLHISLFFELLHKQFPNINGLCGPVQIHLYTGSLENSIFIFNANNNHWFTVANLDSDNIWKIYDSLSYPKESLVKFFQDILPGEEKVVLSFENVEQQVGGNDCGLFALAFVTSLCYKDIPSSLFYDQKSLRNHYGNGTNHHSHGRNDHNDDTADYNHGTSDHKVGASDRSHRPGDHKYGRNDYSNDKTDHNRGTNDHINVTSDQASGIDDHADGTNYYSHGTSEHNHGTGSHKVSTSDQSHGSGDHKDGTNDISNGTNDHSHGTRYYKDGTNDHNHGTNDCIDGTSDHVEGTNNHSHHNSDHNYGIGDHKDSTNDHSNGKSDPNHGTNEHIDDTGDHVDDTNDHSRGISDHTNGKSDRRVGTHDHRRGESDHKGGTSGRGPCFDCSNHLYG
ncbi:unnamed protein product [Rotaria sp. Silwood1]|nr:unnamed protein product [Rotaria sp. Silwood1]CAF4741723.1 unnamed protein product [Rotaria sp. Silwood1]CAF4765556.1 unnamed protein product [Rotaria sp. Silwood1]CAF4874652.1 unnamed protein product [Rotaria sp. Silwood1]